MGGEGRGDRGLEAGSDGSPRIFSLRESLPTSATLLLPVFIYATRNPDFLPLPEPKSKSATRHSLPIREGVRKKKP